MLILLKDFLILITFLAKHKCRFYDIVHQNFWYNQKSIWNLYYII